MTLEQIQKDVRNKIYYPIYFLEGDEPFYIDEISSFLEENILTEAEKSFNQTIFYGREIDHQTVLDSVKRYPMMSSHQVVMIKEAQYMRTLDKLQPYFENPLKSTLLIICFKGKKLNKRTHIAKAILKNGLLFTSEKIKDYKLESWITGYISRKGYKIEPKAARLIADHLGNDLAKIANEVEKLMLNIPPNAAITSKHIEENIGISKDYNIFELQNALGEKDATKANKIINYFAANPKTHPFPMTMGGLYNYFTKLFILHSSARRPVNDNELASKLKTSPFFVKEYKRAAGNYNKAKVYQSLQLLHEYDLRSKGINNSNVPSGELLKELVYKLMH